MPGPLSSPLQTHSLPCSVLGRLVSAGNIKQAPLPATSVGMVKGTHQQGIMGGRQEQRRLRVVTPLTIPFLLDCGSIASSLQDHSSCRVVPLCQGQITTVCPNGSLPFSFRPGSNDSFALLLLLGCSPSTVASLMLTLTFITKPLIYSFNHPFAICREQMRQRCLDYQIPVPVISSILCLIQTSRFRSPIFSLPHCIQKISSYILSVTKICLTCHFYPFVSFFNHNTPGLSPLSGPSFKFQLHLKCHH